VVHERARYLCEYCHSSEEASAAQFAMDHSFPPSLGGSDRLENLVLRTANYSASLAGCSLSSQARMQHLQPAKDFLRTVLSACLSAL
jgi:hypothetical protein